MPRRPSGGPTCSAPRPPSAGPAAGTPCSSRPTASAACAVDDTFKARLRRHLERFRMAGYDLEVNAPRFVPLDVALHICVKADYFRADVLQAVRACAVERRPARRHAGRVPSRQLLLRPAGLSQPRDRRGAGGRGRRFGARRPLPAAGRPEPDVARRRRDRDRRSGDRPARQQSQFPRARQARARRQEAANDDARARPEAPCPAARRRARECCGCCDGIDAETPQGIDNRGGLSAIAYRIGDYAQFRASLHAALSSSAFRAAVRVCARATTTISRSA